MYPARNQETHLFWVEISTYPEEEHFQASTVLMLIQGTYLTVIATLQSYGFIFGNNFMKTGS